jgi:hypothetical protein
VRKRALELLADALFRAGDVLSYASVIPGFYLAGQRVYDAAWCLDEKAGKLP